VTRSASGASGSIDRAFQSTIASKVARDEFIADDARRISQNRSQLEVNKHDPRAKKNPAFAGF
jgi:predicted amino acid dehydrogenase